MLRMRIISLMTTTSCVCKIFQKEHDSGGGSPSRRVIAAALRFVYGRTIHVHLSGTLGDFLALSPAYVLRYGVILWGMENGFHLVHHGGGVTNDGQIPSSSRKGSERTPSFGSV